MAVVPWLDAALKATLVPILHDTVSRNRSGDISGPVLCASDRILSFSFICVTYLASIKI